MWLGNRLETLELLLLRFETHSESPRFQKERDNQRPHKFGDSLCSLVAIDDWKHSESCASRLMIGNGSSLELRQ